MLLGGLPSVSGMLLLIQQYLSENSGRQRLENKHQDIFNKTLRAE